MRFSKEQQRIFDLVCSTNLASKTPGSGDNIANVPAVAGAGKSLLITAIAKRESSRPILFLCHSQSIADRAKSTLPANVDSFTFYEMAYKFLAQVMPSKASQKLSTRLTVPEILSVTSQGTTSFEAERAKQVLSQFYNSHHPHPDESHLPSDTLPGCEWVTSTNDAKGVLLAAKEVWQAQINDEGNRLLPMTQDALVKWWTLSQRETIHMATLNREIVVAPIPSKYELIVIEEAQTLNVAILDFIIRQNASILLLGDEHQALQSGRLDLQRQQHSMYNRSQSLPMSESFRFGASIASFCSALANKSGEVSRDYIKGLGKSAVHGSRRRFDWELAKTPYTFLAERPETLFQEAIDATRRGKVFAWIDGIESYPITFLRDLVVLKLGAQSAYRDEGSRHLIQSASLRNVPSLSVLLERYARQPGHPIARLANWVLHNAEPRMLRMIDGWRKADAVRQKQHRKNWREPLDRDLTLGVVSKALGHEWPLVALGDDLFPSQLFDQAWQVGAKRQQINFAYTAATRAQVELAVPDHVLEHLEHHQWRLAPNDNLLPLGEISSTGGMHTAFGVDRHTLLEMDPAIRHMRRGQLPAGLSSRTVTASGQSEVKRQIEQQADTLAGMSIESLRAQLPLSRKRRQEAK